VLRFRKATPRAFPNVVATATPFEHVNDPPGENSHALHRVVRVVRCDPVDELRDFVGPVVAIRLSFQKQIRGSSTTNTPRSMNSKSRSGQISLSHRTSVDLSARHRHRRCLLKSKKPGRQDVFAPGLPLRIIRHAGKPTTGPCAERDLFGLASSGLNFSDATHSTRKPRRARSHAIGFFRRG